MSRIGKKPVIIPEQVTVEVNGNLVTIRGQKGELKLEVKRSIDIEIKDGSVYLTRKNDEKQTKAYHGLFRSMIQNNVIGVSQGYKKTLKLVGTGYRVNKKGTGLNITVGFSHPIDVAAVEGIIFSLEGNDTIHVEGIDKHKVGQVAANIRALRSPEPYKGKGIRYEDEYVKIKPGKSAVT
jgi:large subunit ribosomal protein L6